MMSTKREHQSRRRTLADRMSWQPKGVKRRRPLLRLAAVCVVLGALVAGALYVLVFSSLFWVSAVNISGPQTISPDELKQAVLTDTTKTLGPLTTKSLVLVSRDQLSTRLKDRFEDIAEVQVVKQWPRTLAVNVQERQTTLLWKTDQDYYLVDRQGVAFQKTSQMPGLVAVEDSTKLPVEVGKQIVGRGFIAALEQIRAELAKAGLAVTVFRIPETTFEVQAVTNQGYYAIFDTTRPIPTQADALVRAVATGKPSQYADLRVPGRVYLK